MENDGASIGITILVLFVFNFIWLNSRFVDLPEELDDLSAFERFLDSIGPLSALSLLLPYAFYLILSVEGFSIFSAATSLFVILLGFNSVGDIFRGCYKRGIQNLDKFLAISLLLISLIYYLGSK